MLMSASDICAITKPWPVQKQVSFSHTHSPACMQVHHNHMCMQAHTQKHTLINAHTHISLSFSLPRQIAELVATELYAQGDQEKCEFNIQANVSLELCVDFLYLFTLLLLYRKTLYLRGRVTNCFVVYFFLLQNVTGVSFNQMFESKDVSL